MSTTNHTIRDFLIASIGGLALLISACNKEPSSTASSAQHTPVVGRTSYGHQRARQTFEKLLEIARGSEDLMAYRGTIDSVFEEEYGGISSTVLSVAGKDTKVTLQLGKESYQVTDGVYDQSEVLSGLFDPRGEPLMRKNCQQGDEIGVVCWKRDQKGADKSYLPVRAFGNYTRDYFMSSAELLRHLRFIGLDLTGCHVIFAGSEKNARGYWATSNPQDRASDIYPTKYFLIRSTPLSREWMRAMQEDFEEQSAVQQDYKKILP